MVLADGLSDQISKLSVAIIAITLAAVLAGTDRLSTAELQSAVHEIFTAEFLNGTACFFHAAHGDKGKAFGALRAVVHHDFAVTDTAQAAEEFKEVALGGVIGEIAHVEAFGADVRRIDGDWLTTWLGFTWWAAAVVIAAGFCADAVAAGLSRSRAGKAFGFSEQAKADGAEKFLKSCWLFVACTWGATWAGPLVGAIPSTTVAAAAIVSLCRSI